MTLSFEFWQRWLLVACLSTAALGLGLAFLNQTPVFGVNVNRPFGLDTQQSAQVVVFQRWIYGVLGATVAGWAITMAFIAAYPFGRREPWSWACIASALALWFAVDTSISLYFGVMINVVLNMAILLAIGVALAATRKYFAHR